MLLELQNLGKSFGEHEVLKDVNAGVERGDRIGIIGANGTGKTTLLRILCGESLPDAGDAAFGTGVTCGYLEQNARLAPTLDIYATMKLAFAPALDAMQKMDDLQRRLAADPHNTALTEEIAHCTAIVDAMDAYNMDTQIKKVLNGMGFPVDTWVKLAGVLSGGEQTRLRLARLLLERPDLLILDEPTNHLDLETMEWLENYLKTYRGAVLVVSHDRYFLDAGSAPASGSCAARPSRPTAATTRPICPSAKPPTSASKNCMTPLWKRPPNCRTTSTATLCAPPPPRWPRAAASSWKSWRSWKHRPPKPTS